MHDEAIEQRSFLTKEARMSRGDISFSLYESIQDIVPSIPLRSLSVARRSSALDVTRPRLSRTRPATNDAAHDSIGRSIASKKQ